VFERLGLWDDGSYFYWCAVQKRWEREDGKEESWTAGLVLATSAATKDQGTLPSCNFVVMVQSLVFVDVECFLGKIRSC
jgi:hypothetical protein